MFKASVFTLWRGVCYFFTYSMWCNHRAGREEGALCLTLIISNQERQAEITREDRVCQVWSVHALNEEGGMVFPSSFDVDRYPFDSRWRETFKEAGLMSVDVLRPAVFLCLELFHPNRVSRVCSSPQLNFPSELWNLPHWNPEHISAHEFQRNADIRLSLFHLRLFIFLMNAFMVLWTWHRGSLWLFCLFELKVFFLPFCLS